MRAAANHGLKVLLTINHAPVFAEGAGRPASAPAGSWEPNPSDLADFAQAVAARYSGGFDPDGPAGQPALPAAYGIQVWNEPNSTDWLAPQFDGKRIVGADLYRSMLNAAYKSIKQVNPRMQVVVGGTDPYGDPPGGPYPPNVQRVRPVEFWDAVFCVRQAKSKKGKKGKKKKLKFVRTAGCSSPALFDVFAHHPIDNTGGGPLRHGPSKFDASTPDLSRVVNVLRAAERFGTASGGHHPVWVTEFWWDSKPPNPVGAPLATQARWIEQSMYLFWKAGASAAISFQIADSTLRPDVHAGLQAGVYFNDGRPKPSLTAFSFPFVTDRINSRKLLAWGKAPAERQAPHPAPPGLPLDHREEARGLQGLGLHLQAHPPRQAAPPRDRVRQEEPGLEAGGGRQGPQGRRRRTISRRDRADRIGGHGGRPDRAPAAGPRGSSSAVTAASERPSPSRPDRQSRG